MYSWKVGNEWNLAVRRSSWPLTFFGHVTSLGIALGSGVFTQKPKVIESVMNYNRGGVQWDYGCLLECHLYSQTNFSVPMKVGHNIHLK